MASVGQQIDVASIQPQRDLILCIRYERPEQTAGGLIIPDPFRIDPFWAYWEVVTAGPDCEKQLGIRLDPGDIIRTPFRPGIDSGFEDAEGRRLYFVACRIQQPQADGKLKWVGNVTGVIPNTWSKEE